jgi:hypothetical protein
MKDIQCALQGRLGADAELRRSASGKDWCRLSVGVGEGDAVTWVSVSFFEEKAGRLQGSRKAPRAAGVRGVGVGHETEVHLAPQSGNGIQFAGPSRPRSIEAASTRPSYKAR